MVRSQTTSITPAQHAYRHRYGGADPLTGDVRIDEPTYLITPSANTLHTNAPEITGTADSNHYIVKEIRLYRSGTIRTVFSYTGAQIGQSAAQVFKNGVAHGTLRAATNGTVTYTEDLAFTAGDLYQIDLLVNIAHVGKVKNMLINGECDMIPVGDNQDP